MSVSMMLSVISGLSYTYLFRDKTKSINSFVNGGL